MDPNELISVYQSKNANKAELLRSELQGEGIACEIDGQNQGGFAGIMEINLLVRAKDAERARRFIKEHEG